MKQKVVILRAIPTKKAYRIWYAFFASGDFLAALVVGATGCSRSFRSNFRPKKFSPDGVHPTDLGNEYIACRRQERDSFGK